MKPILSLLIVVCATSVFAQELFEIPSGKQTRWSSFENPTAAKSAGGKETMARKDTHLTWWSRGARG